MWSARRKKVLCVIVLPLLIICCAGLINWYHSNVLIEKIPRSNSHLSDLMTLKADNWIVITTTQLPADEVRKWTNLTDWHLVVVCDKRTPGDWSPTDIIFLDRRMQISLGFEVDENSMLGKKEVIGYLFAIQFGAKAVYMADETHSADVFNRVSLSNNWGLISSSNGSFFDAGQHFGCFSRTKEITSSYSLCETNTAVYVRAEIIRDHAAAEVACDASAPSATMGIGTYLDITATGLIFIKSGFWAFHPFVEVDYNSVWSYMVQWLLWNTKYRLTVFWSGAHHASRGRRKQISNLINVISRSDCEVDFIMCTLNVTRKLIDAALVNEGFLSAVEAWFHILKRSGYVFPELSLVDTCTDYLKYHPLDFVSGVRGSTAKVPITNLNESLHLYNQTCKNSKTFAAQYQQFTASFRPLKQFTDILLLVTFNTPRYEVIPHLEILYRRIFPNIIYCGPAMIPSTDETLNKYKIFFLTNAIPSLLGFPGGMSYECAIKVSRINFHVKGYLTVSDDILLFPSVMTELQNDIIWFTPLSKLFVIDLISMTERRDGKWGFAPFWEIWHPNRPQIMDAVRVMSSACNVSLSSPLCKCSLKLKDLFGDLWRLTGFWIADTWYIPQKLMKDFGIIADVFFNSRVYFEVAIPTALTCLGLAENIKELTGDMITDSSRTKPWLNFPRTNQSGKSYLHPVKWSGLTTSSAEHINLYCDTVMPMYYKV